MATAARIPELPNEILRSIFEHPDLPLKDLKNVRLASKSLAMMVEPRLFRRMVLVPYIDCLEPFARFMRNNPIVHHVQTFVYDGTWRYSSGLVARPWSEEVNAIQTKLRNNALVYAPDQQMEVALLSKCLGSLPSLKKIVVCEIQSVESYSISPHNALPFYFRRLMKGANIERWARLEGPSSEMIPSTRIALLACYSSGVKIDQFRVTDLDAQAFLDPIDGRNALNDMPVYQNVLGQLKSLQLFFRPRFSLHFPYARETFARFLLTAKNIEALHLSMTDFELHTSRLRARHSWLFRMVRDSKGNIRHKAIFPHLKKLSFSSMVCQESELVAFIHDHRKTLEELSLQSMTLVRSLDQTSPPCWVRLFKSIRRYRLKFGVLGGTFSNMSRQRWLVLYSVGDNQSLKRRTMAWLSGEGSEECPIERAAVKVDSNGAEIFEPEEDSFKGDDSWIVYWDRLDETDEEDEEEEEGEEDEEDEEDITDEEDYFSDEDEDDDFGDDFVGTYPGMAGILQDLFYNEFDETDDPYEF